MAYIDWVHIVQIVFFSIIGFFVLNIAIKITKRIIRLAKCTIKARMINKKAKEYAEYCRHDVEITTKVYGMMQNDKPIRLCNERVIWFNNLSKTEQHNFLEFVESSSCDMDGDIIYLSETQRAITLRKSFPSEELFDPKEKVVVRGIVSMFGRIVHMCIVFPIMYCRKKEAKKI